MLLAALDLATAAEGVTVLGFAYGAGAGITKVAARRRDAAEKAEAARDKKELGRDSWEETVDTTLFGAAKTRTSEERAGIVRDLRELSKNVSENTKATVELTRRVERLEAR